MVVTEQTVGDTWQRLHKKYFGFDIRCGEETVVHPLAESDPTALRVHSDRRHHSYINFFYFQRGKTRLENPEPFTCQWIAKWYHPEAFTLHKREIYLAPFTSQPMEQRTDVRLARKRPEKQEVRRPGKGAIKGAVEPGAAALQIRPKPLQALFSKFIFSHGSVSIQYSWI